MDGKMRRKMIGTKALEFAYATGMTYGEAVDAIEVILSRNRRLSSITVKDLKALSESKGEQ